MPNKDEIWPEVPEWDEQDQPRKPAPAEAKQTESADEAGELDEAETAGAFGKDLLRLALPFRSAGEVSIFICVFLLFVAIPMLNFLSLICCLNLILLIGIWGCLASFFFNVLTDTAEGEDHLPQLNALLTTLREDFWQGVIIPITNFYVAIFYAFSPCIIISAIYYLTTGKRTALADWPVPLFIILLVVGVFFTPMALLILAQNKLFLLFNPVKIFRTILNVWKPYLLCWLCLLIAAGLAIGVNFLVEPLVGEPFSASWTAVTLAISILDIWVWIYAMRVIGLLWRHYQHRFGWDVWKERPLI